MGNYFDPSADDNFSSSIEAELTERNDGMTEFFNGMIDAIGELAAANNQQSKARPVDGVRGPLQEEIYNV